MSRGFLIHVVPALVYLGVIFWLGTAHVSVQLPTTLFSQDKISHFGAFGLLVVLVFRALRHECRSASQRQLVGASVAASSFTGALLELWQYLLPHRSFELADWLADTLGAGLAGLVLMLSARRRQGQANSMQSRNPAVES